MSRQSANILWFETLSHGDVALIGGKNSSLGEMVQQLDRKGIKVLCGFATSADACRAFLAANALPSRIADRFQRWRNHKLTLHKAGMQLRAMILAEDWSKDIKADIRKAYRALSRRAKTTDLSVAVRSSATAGDLPDACFAGQQEACLNVRGEAGPLAACRRCFASLSPTGRSAAGRLKVSTSPR